MLEGFSRKLYKCKNILNFKDPKLITNLDIPINIAQVNIQNLHSFLVMLIAVVALILSVYNLYQKLDLPVNVWMVLSLLFPISALIGTIIMINYNWYKIYTKLMNIKAAEITEHFNFEKKSFNSLQQRQNDINSDIDNKKIDSSEKEATKQLTAFVKNSMTAFMEYAKKNNFIKYSIIRFPQPMLLIWAFYLSTVATKKINFDLIYSFWLFVLAFLLTLLLAIYDCIFYKVLEKP
jgi:hypothetical protein